jgi:hypothetical protein
VSPRYLDGTKAASSSTAQRRGAATRRSSRRGLVAKNRILDESGRIGYVLLYFMGVPVGILLIMWALLGDNIIGAG